MTDRDVVRSGLRPVLARVEQQILLLQARRALEAGLSGRPFYPDADSPGLSSPGAAFVTLRGRHTGELRGCCGETEARRPLAESVSAMALATALSDPRFPAVGREEVDDLSIEITVLGPMSPIEPPQIEVGRHGLMIRKGTQRGLLLPQVPMNHGWDRSQFLAHVCRKAGLWGGAWVEDSAELLAFEAVWWGEGSDAGPPSTRG